MAVDWHSVIEEHQASTDRISKDIMALLIDPEVAIDQISATYEMTKKAVQAMDALQSSVESDPYAEDGHLLAVDILQDVWSNLIAATGNKIRIMQGLPISEARYRKN